MYRILEMRQRSCSRWMQGEMISACEEHREALLEEGGDTGAPRSAESQKNGLPSRRSNPGEMTVCLSAVPVPSAVVQVARYLESVNRLGRVYCSDTEFRGSANKEWEDNKTHSGRPSG